jgi:hypothetical protein
MQKQIRDWNYSNKDMDFVEFKRSLPCLMQPTINPCPEADDSSSHLSPDSMSLLSIWILSSHLRLGVPTVQFL